MDQISRRRRVIIGTIITAIMVGGVVYAVFGRNTNDAIDPNQDEALDLHEGTSLYQAGTLYRLVEENDDIFSLVEKDILFFARTTHPEFKNPDTLVGFTFDKRVSKKENTTIFTGYFYGLQDKIEIRLTPHGKGVYTLSITNLKDKTNIDDQLSMNGRRNAFIRTLPIKKEYYSIRYQLPLDRIVVTFYDGYTNESVDEVILLIRNALGDAENQNVVYSVNRIGELNLEQIRQNLISPLSQP